MADTSECRCALTAIVNLTTNVEMLAVDTTNGWAGTYCFCWSDPRSPHARRRLARELDTNSPSRRRDDRIIMCGTTPPCAKLTGDSGKGFQPALIGDCRLFRPLAENQPQDFLGHLQHHRRRALGAVTNSQNVGYGMSGVGRRADSELTDTETSVYDRLGRKWHPPFVHLT
jgi:hypothetical protein